MLENICKWILRKPIYWIIKRIYPEMLEWIVRRNSDYGTKLLIIIKVSSSLHQLKMLETRTFSSIKTLKGGLIWKQKKKQENI